jgi:sodium transport system ATP-binding protein
MVEVENLKKVYADLAKGEFVALAGINFRAQPGEIFGLLGPNGAGKTTALRILSTVLRPSSGLVRVNGFDVMTHPAEVRRSIGFV